MNTRKRKLRWCGFAGAMMALLAGGASSALAVQAGITLDVHQDSLEPLPNDFHIEGLVLSKNGIPPTILQHLDGPFSTFACSFTPLPALEPESCWYQFVADWSNPLIYPNGIPYCTVIHLGLLFDVDAANTVIDLIGWWTLDGARVGDIMGTLTNGGAAPLVGFQVSLADNSVGEILRIANGGVINPQPLPPIGPPRIPIQIVQADVIAFPAGIEPLFSELREDGAQSTWPWTPILGPSGNPISPTEPLSMVPDSFFDVFLEIDTPGEIRPLTPVSIPPNGFLVARTQFQFVNNNNEVETRWEWEIHEDPALEACCMPDGTCIETTSERCVAFGGSPQGMGTTCDTVICEQTLLEACCLPDGTCAEMPAEQCLQEGGTPHGTGSICLGDANGDGVDDLCQAKWLQKPDLSVTGVDVKADDTLILGDDFLCTQTNALTDITIWGSWENDVPPGESYGDVTFKLAFYSDIPAQQTGDYSRPGELLWQTTFEPGTFVFEPFATDINEGWWDPSRPESYVFPGDHICWQYSFHLPPEKAFCQQGSAEAPIVYWLVVHAVPTDVTAHFGWKSSLDHWNDDAVWAIALPEWQELIYPVPHQYAGQSMDLAFSVLSTAACIESDLGDAPDSTNNFGVVMTAYPNGVQANFPTVYRTGSPPYGPIHFFPNSLAFLGAQVTNEDEADTGTDFDGINNIQPLGNLADLDGADDGVQMPLVLPNCQATTFNYTVNVVNPQPNTPLYVNVWFDWNRDGDWDDTVTCPAQGNAVPEWAVQNQTLSFATIGLFTVTTPPFISINATADAEPIWMRITLAEQPYVLSPTIGSGGSGPAAGYQIGETEDYFFVPQLPDITPPHIIGAISRRVHGSVGSFDIDLLNTGSYDVATEDRRDGPQLLLITFDEPITYVLSPAAAVVVTGTGASAGTISSTSIAGSQLTINMSGASDVSRLQFRFPGIADLAGNVVTENLCIGVLSGDVGQQSSWIGDGVVNIYDLINIKNVFDQSVSVTTFRADIGGVSGTGPDGIVNIFDLIAVKDNMDRTIHFSCPP